MTESRSLTPLRNEDYEAIEAAVMETARGRWFLAEYARRNRAADTNMLLDAIHKLEDNLRRHRDRPDIDMIKLDIADMADAIERTKKEIAQIAAEGQHGGRIFDASNELDAIVEHTESATQEILSTAEAVQELAFEMREAGVDGAFCDKLEEYSTNFYMACSFQDLTGQRTQKVVHVLRYLESRVNAMMKIWHIDGTDIGKAEPAPHRPDDTRPDAHLLNGPQLGGEGVDQADIDSLMAEVIDEDADLAAFEAETLDIRDEAVDAGEHRAEPPILIDNDLEFADADLMATGDTAEDVAAIDADPAGSLSGEPVGPDPMEAGGGQDADIFELTGEVELAPAQKSFAAAEDDEFAGADVFEVSRPARAVEAAVSTATDAAADDPTLGLSPGERMALFH